MRALVKAFDRFMVRRLEIFEFTQNPECLLRLRLIRANRAIQLGECTIPSGIPLLELHLWNEHLPTIPAQGAGLEYGITGRRLMLRSLHLLARELDSDPQLSAVQALYGLTWMVAAGSTSGGERLARRIGFYLYPYRPPLGRFGEYWEYLYARILMWAYNPTGLDNLRFSSFRRSEIWMLKEDFLQRYLESAGN